jgi:hypothetical protein
MTGSAKQSRATSKNWIASSQELLAMTSKKRSHIISKKEKNLKKKEQGPSPAQKLCRPYFPAKLDLILFGGATLLVRARAPPETWTTRLQPYGQPEVVVVDHLFRLVINFSNDCSKFMHLAK